MSLAIAYFGSNGYTVSVPLNDTQWYDLVVEKDGKLYTVQCKFTATTPSTIDTRSSGGTHGSQYDSVPNHPQLDYIFCANADGDMWLIPLEALYNAGNKKSFRLIKDFNNYAPKSKTFDTSKFLVNI